MERRIASIATVTTSLHVVLPPTPTTTADTKTRKKIPKKILRKIQRRMEVISNKMKSCIAYYSQIDSTVDR
jgi:hypothetical protein